MKLLEAVEKLSATQLFCVAYTWNDPLLGELDGHTVVDAIDAEIALRSFRSKNSHLTKAWIIE
jgi:hypothetical protein